MLCAVGTVLLHFFEFIGISSANEVALHVVYVTIGVHQVLLVFALNLNAAHDYVVLNVDAFLFFIPALEILAPAGSDRHLLLDLLMLVLLVIVYL